MPLAAIIDTFRSALSANHVYVKLLSDSPQLRYTLLSATGLVHAAAGRIDDACEAYLEGAELGTHTH